MVADPGLGMATDIFWLILALTHLEVLSTDILDRDLDLFTEATNRGVIVKKIPVS